MKRLLTAVLLVIALGLPALDLAPPMREYTTSSEFGFRADPIMGGATDTLHGGVDLVAPPGTPVNATASGTVVKVWPPPGVPYLDGRYYKGHPVFGGLVEIEHEDGSLTRSGHLSRADVREGQKVAQGEQIGVIGNTGLSTGTHLHFERLARPGIPTTVVRPDPLERMIARLVKDYRTEQARRFAETGIVP